MQIQKLLVLTSFIATALAHTRVWGVWVNGADQGNGVDQYVCLNLRIFHCICLILVQSGSLAPHQ